MRAKPQVNQFLLTGIFLAFLMAILGTWGIPSPTRYGPSLSQNDQQHHDQNTCDARAYAKTIKVNGQFCAQVLSCKPDEACQEHQQRYACAPTPRQYVFRTHEKQPGCFELFAKESGHTKKGPFLRLCDLCLTQTSKVILP